MFIPAAVLEWGFVGGATAVLFRVAYTQDAKFAPRVRFATWIVAKPIIGMVMGALAYFIAMSGNLALGGSGHFSQNQFVYVLAFLGGFSDRFSIEMINRVVGPPEESASRSE